MGDRFYSVTEHCGWEGESWTWFVPATTENHDRLVALRACLAAVGLHANQRGGLTSGSRWWIDTEAHALPREIEADSGGYMPRYMHGPSVFPKIESTDECALHAALYKGRWRDV